MNIHTSLIPLFAALAALPIGALASATGRIPVGSETTPGNGSCVYVISQPGSYYLAGPVLGVPGKGGIIISAAGVTLDLNGFSVTGTDGSAGYGLRVENVDGAVRITNGSVQNWAGDGIHLLGGTVDLSHLVTSDNGKHGIVVGAYATGNIVDCISEQNREAGFSMYGVTGHKPAGNFTRCIARKNSGVGFRVQNAIVSHCSALENRLTGIDIYEGTLVDSYSNSNSTLGVYAIGALVERCTVRGNAGEGINLSGGTVRNCAILGNGFSGIRSNGLAEIYDNRVHGHSNGASAGIVVGGGYNRVENNNLSHNGYGIKVTGTTNFIARNTARSLIRNYSIAAGNRVGAIVAPSLSGAIESNSGGGTGTTDPWSNIAY